MSDDFQKHINRVKAENGEKWAADFDAEFAGFKLCSLIARAREFVGLSIGRASELSKVPEKIISRIENEDTEVDGKYFDALTKFYTQELVMF